MKIELCTFSALKVYPGHGKRIVRVDGKAMHFLNAKCAQAHYLKRNPRKISWTVLYRRKHKKGQIEEAQKRKTRKTVKINRDIAGASLAEIMMKRQQKPEFRKAQREQAIRAAKDVTRARDVERKKKTVEKKQPLKQQKPTKPVTKAAPRVGGKR